MNYDILKTLWLSEEQRAFSGWDFSHLDSRRFAEPLPWDYKKIIENYVQPSYQLLDMGTGGGEFLLSLNHPHELTSVTEAWPPNIKLCRELLEPLGIHVYQVFDDSHIPIDDNMFDIVINRHEAYALDEVTRILKPGGMFITQQVGGDNNRLLAERLNPDDAPLYPKHALKTEVPEFDAHRLKIRYRDEAFPEARFYDVGAVVYFAKIIEWEFPNFSVDRNFSQLCALHDERMTKGFISSREHRFVIAAQNMKSF